MYEQTELGPLVRQWEAEGKWIDYGKSLFWEQVSPPAAGTAVPSVVLAYDH